MGIRLEATLAVRKTYARRDVTQKIYGYYDKRGQVDPTVDVAHEAPCLCCGSPVTPADVVTISMMPVGGTRSFFYRTHRTCFDAMTGEQREEIDRVVIDSIIHHHDGWPVDPRRMAHPV